MSPDTSPDEALAARIADLVPGLMCVDSAAALPYPEPLNAGMTSLPNHSSCSRITL